MNVVRLGVSDVGRIVGVPGLFDSPPDSDAIRTYLADDRNVFFIAVEGDRVLGFLRGTALNQITAKRQQMFIYEVSVLAESRRRGVGSALIRAILEYCSAHDFEEAFVFTDPGNAPAVGLYTATGASTETPADRMFVYNFE